MEEWITRAWAAGVIAGPVLAGVYAWVRAQTRQLRNEAAALRRELLELRGEEVKVDDEAARAEQRRKQEQSDWAVKQAMALFEEAKKQVALALYKADRAVRAESRCRVLVATLYTQVREMQRKLKIDRADPTIDDWVESVLNPRDAADSDDQPAPGAPNG